MVIPVILLKIAASKNNFRNQLPTPPPSVSTTSSTKRDYDYDSLLNLSASTHFSYLMLVAFEGGSLLRALLLLLLYPLVYAIGFYDAELSLRILVFVAFCGMKVRDMDLVARAVLPKFFLENLDRHVYEQLRNTDTCSKNCSLPGVMVTGFLKEYLGLDAVVGTQLSKVCILGKCYYTGFQQVHGGNREEKETSNSAKRTSTEKYPKPLIFHDSRLAFLPTPLSILSLFLFLPPLIPLSIARIFVGILLPYKLMFPLAASLGTRFRSNTQLSPPPKLPGVIYVCTHRTLLDPVMLAIALQRPVPAVTYSVSPLSEALAPMRTVRLTRNRQTDANTMLRLLQHGELTICPEGTTCREPYLLRFSPLFAEMSDRIVPAAMEAEGSWFYGTTASGLKSLDPLVFFMNPWPMYRVRILDPVPKKFTCAGGMTGSEVANRIQKELGDALGFECTALTRKDKYMMLAGNEGVVVKKE